MEKRTATYERAMLVGVLMVACMVSGWSQDTVRDFCGINGVSLFHLYESPQKWEIAGGRLAAGDWVGFGWQRCDFWWSRIEPKKDTFDFSYSDKVVEKFLENGRRLMPILCYSSAWQPKSSPVAAEEQELYARYVYNLVNRYKDRVKDWEVWNEPNITPFWVPKPDARDYAELLKRAYREAKRADAGCNVVGLCTAGADYPFIETVYERGGGKAFDTLSFHHYNERLDESILEKEIYEIKSIMNRYGDGQKKIWITEIGLQTGWVDDCMKPVSEGVQASGMIKKLLTAMGTRVVGRVFWFTIDDWTKDPQVEGHMGIFDNDLVPKPSAFAFRTLLRILGAQEYVGCIMLTPTARCYVFKNGHDELTGVLWTRHLEEEVLVHFDKKETRVYSLYGEYDAMILSDVAVGFKLTPIPVYLTGLDKSYGLLASVKSDEMPILLAAGQKKEIVLTLENVDRQGQRVEITGEMKGGSIELPDVAQNIRGKSSTTIRGAVSVDSQAEAGWKEWRVSIKGADVAAAPKSAVLDNAWVSIPVRVLEPLKMQLGFVSEGAPIKLNGIVKNVSAEKMSGSLSWQLEPAGKVSRAPEEFRDFAPAGIKEFGGHLRTGFGEKNVCLVAKIEVCGEREFSAHRRVAGMPFRDKAGFTIDGSLVDWEGIAPLALNSKEQLVLDKGAEKWSSQDLSGIVRLCCDKENLYVALDITDDQPMINPYKETDIWRGDGAELYVGFGGPTLEHWYGEKDFQIGLTPGWDGEAPYCWVWKIGGVGKKLEKTQVAVQKTARGYAMEGKIALGELGAGDITPPALVGFDVALNDLDDRGERAEKDRELMWNGTDTNWRDPSNWGAVQFQRSSE